MYELIFYHARNGQSEIEAHLDALAKEAQTNKTSRINREKILAYYESTLPLRNKTRNAIRQTHWWGSLGASTSEQPHLFLLLER